MVRLFKSEKPKEEVARKPMIPVVFPHTKRKKRTKSPLARQRRLEAEKQEQVRQARGHLEQVSAGAIKVLIRNHELVPDNIDKIVVEINGSATVCRLQLLGAGWFLPFKLEKLADIYRFHVGEGTDVRDVVFSTDGRVVDLVRRKKPDDRHSFNGLSAKEFEPARIVDTDRPHALSSHT